MESIPYVPIILYLSLLNLGAYASPTENCRAQIVKGHTDDLTVVDPATHRIPRRVDFAPDLSIGLSHNPQLLDFLNSIPLQFLGPTPPDSKYHQRLLLWTAAISKLSGVNSPHQEIRFNSLSFKKLIELISSVPENFDIVFVGSNADHIVNMATQLTENTRLERKFYALRASTELATSPHLLEINLIDELLATKSPGIVIIDSMTLNPKIEDRSLFKIYRRLQSRTKKTVLALAILESKDSMSEISEASKDFNIRSEFLKSLPEASEARLGELKTRKWKDSNFHILDVDGFWTHLFQLAFTAPRWNGASAARGLRIIQLYTGFPLAPPTCS